VLEALDAVLDVGGVYDPARDRYDHHQKGFEEVLGHGFSTKLSSAGLVYKVKFSYKLPILVMVLLSLLVYIIYFNCTVVYFSVLVQGQIVREILF